MLKGLEGNQKQETRTLFSQRLCGRSVTLGCYLFLGYSMELIHAILIRKKLTIEETKEGETPHKILRLAFFIDGLGSDDTDDGRSLCIQNICNGLSLWEKEELKKWWANFESFITQKVVDKNLLDLINEKRKKTSPPVLD